MATKRPSRTKTKPKTKPTTTLQNLAARPNAADDAEDEQLVDHSGVFRVTTKIARDQIGHDEGAPSRFASDSLAMAAQRNRPTDDLDPDDVAEPPQPDDDVLLAEKRQRLQTLSTLARNRNRR
jgi:hypothetical protein